ncbi:MAG TPA: glycerol-3-phosphate dehydrogenase [Chitinophagaceae bacterium]|nr:glycerol-3-phosphate dehydrogenase [Chitinophagaceae bacterium]
MQPLQHITIIGGGSWATALVKIFSESNIRVTWYLRSQQQVDYLLAHGRNRNYLGFLQLDLQFIRPVSSLKEAVASADDVLFAVPSVYLEQELAPLAPPAVTGKNLYVSVKGIVSEDLLIPSVFLSKFFQHPVKNITVLAGPCHAEEVAAGRKTYLTIAGKNDKLVVRMAKAITSHYISTVKNSDPHGVEYAGILKNVIGIASGMVKGMNYGDNFLAVVICNAMKEVSQFLQAVDHAPRNLYDSAYFGDLLVTAYSPFSRNRTFGEMIGRGYSIPLAESRMSMTAEGQPAVKGILQMAKMIGLHMPVISAVYRMLYQHASPYAEFKLLENQLR